MQFRLGNLLYNNIFSYCVMLIFSPQANVVCVVFDVMVEETLERVMIVELFDV